MRSKLLVLVLLFNSSSIFSAEVEPIRDRACPDAWSFTDRVIPVVYQDASLNKWPWGVAPSTDRPDAQAHILSVNPAPIATIDGTALTSVNLQNDLLTIASECLLYRNMLVDGQQFHPPSPPLDRNAATGFIPASVF
jgi:hypothetical protein